MIIAACLILLGLVCPVVAEESTLARLSFWVPQEHMAEFADIYEEKVGPLLQRRGLVESVEPNRTALDSVFSRLFVVASPVDVLEMEQSLAADSVWVATLERWAKKIGTGALRTQFRVYKTPAGSGRTIAAGPGFRQGVWQTFSVEDGLPGSMLVETIQDSSGDLWFAVNGVCRYDGYSFTTFTQADGLASGAVGTMLEDQSGNVWFGFGGSNFLRAELKAKRDGDAIVDDRGHPRGRGVSRYDGRVFENFTRADGLANDIVMDIAEDRSGNLWFGTYGGGVSRYDGETFTTFNVQDGLVGDIVTSIVEDRSGNLWFGTYGGGVSRYDGERFTTFTAQDGLVDNWIISIFEDNAGQLWFGTNGGGHSQLGGISCYNGKSFTNFSAEHNIYAQYIYDIMEDREGHLWFARYPHFLTRFDGQDFVYFTTVDGLANNGVINIFEDRSGTLWISTNGGGISRYDGAQFTQFTTEEGLAASLVFAIAEDRDGNIWAGTSRGLNRYDGRTWQTFDRQDGLASSAVFSITQDDEGTLWFGNVGISSYDQQKMAPLTIDSELNKLRVNAAFHDRQGHLWFGTVVGAFRYDGTSIEKLTTADGLAGDNIRVIAEDTKGHLWFGTYGGSGVSRYDGVSWKIFNTEDGLARNDVYSILEDSSGNLWFGTFGGGVSRYDGRTFTNFTMTDGLAGNSVLSIIEDRLGKLWFGTFGGGVSRYDGQVFQTLSRQDGLGSDAVQQVIEDQEGRLWFATEAGITRYRPSHLKPSIEMVQILADRSYVVEREIGISSEQEVITFSFRGRSFTTRNDRLVYLYRLQGLEDEWQQTRQTRVEYGRLPPGEYEFQVKAVDRDLNYSEQAATAKVVVRYPYAQLALWVGLGLALVGLVATGSYAVNKRRSQLQAERALLQELEDELQTAHDLQMNLMPTGSPHLDGFDIAGHCIPANHVGGDFFQYYPLLDGKLALSLADVTGHGMEAAIPVVMFSGILRSQMELGDPLDRRFGRLNRTLYDSLDNRTFVCFLMGELAPATRTLRLANSGCPYPYHFRAASGEVVELQIDGYPLGVRADTIYSDIDTSLSPGDYIVFNSDGIIEAENIDGEFFGFERTAETIRQGCQEGLSAETLIDRLIGAVQAFAGDAPQGDDMTVVVLKVEG